MLLHAKDKDSEGAKVNPRVYNEGDEMKMGRSLKAKMRVPDYNSYLSEFDDYVASEKFGSGVSKNGFEMGDMVWGKVKSHPWWPGYIFNEAFVSPSVRCMKKIGYVLVAFFGDCSYGWFHPSQLLPFEPHFEEKSKQTESSIFVKAVEEAMEELGKISALGLTCKCRNPFNFKASNVQGYSVVDVIGYEHQAVYSSKRIKKARDGFSSVEMLSFVKQCALAPRECDTEELKFLQRKAVVYAYRRAVFEEFDDTFKQAFGARTGYSAVKSEEVFNRPSPRAPLSGSRINAEALGDAKSSIMKVKDSTKSEKYLPIRREEAGDMTVRFGKVQASSQLQGYNGTSGEDHLLQRQTLDLQTPLKDEQKGVVSMDFTSSSGESYVSKLYCDDDKGLAQESTEGIGEKAALVSPNEKFEAMTSFKQEDSGIHSRSNKGSTQPVIERKWSAGVGIKKANVLKRSSKEMDFENVPSDLRKKKKKEPGTELNRDISVKKEAFSSVETWAKKSSQLGAAERRSNLLNTRNSKLDVLQLLSNLQALSLDPFFGSLDRSSIRAVRQFFLRFRSLVYHKSLASSPPPTNKGSTNEPSKVEGKRKLPHPQLEIPSTKKLKKTSQFRPMASYEKTNQEAKKISNPALNPVRDKGCPVPVIAKPAKAQPVQKIAQPTKVIEPTMLVMKFPSGASLPSEALLKARFSRFGMLDQSATRVFWKSSSCRVVFLYKLDAQTAFRYVSGSNSLFGNLNVAYSLLDVKAASASRNHQKKKAKTNEPITEPLSQRPEPTPALPQPKIKLKSCLKKSNGNRRTTRVRFMVDEKETETTYPVSRKKKGNYASPLPPILPLTSQYSAPKHVKNSVDHVESTQCTVDISQEMMKLLLRCSDVVANVKSLLGYVPYHSL